MYIRVCADYNIKGKKKILISTKFKFPAIVMPVHSCQSLGHTFVFHQTQSKLNNLENSDWWPFTDELVLAGS
ncbi:hypothetical protein XENTR_v10009170 [Xenopus tropicalis]|nr:hypothetical protein XENTR_v10009170 [Xenopus tropicalis]